LADLLYYSFLITFIVLAPSALLSEFLKFVQPTCTIVHVQFIGLHSLPRYLPLVVCCTMHSTFVTTD